MGENSSKPVVTVIVPVYNMASMLPDALKSIQEQTFKDWECVVVDDASTDLSYNVARAFGECDPRIWTLRLERNGGAPRAFNAGLDRARGKYVAHLAADDYFLPEFLAECVTVLENDQMCPAVYTDFIEWKASWKRIRRMSDFNYKRLLRENYVNYSAFLMRRIMRLDPRWEPVADWKAVIETAKYRPLVHLPKILAVRRIHSEQISALRNGEMIRRSFLLSFGYSPVAAVRRLYQAMIGVVWRLFQ